MLGAEVVSVITTDDGLSEGIETGIPIYPKLADRVSVESSSGQRVKLKKPTEIFRDHEHNNVGAIRRLLRKSETGLKNRPTDAPDEYKNYSYLNHRPRLQMSLDGVMFSIAGQEFTLGQLLIIPTLLMVGYLGIRWSGRRQWNRREFLKSPNLW